MEKETKQKKQQLRQANCFNCGSYRLQLLSIEQEGKDYTRLNLLCLDCGIIQELTIKGNAKVTQPTTIGRFAQ